MGVVQYVDNPYSDNALKLFINRIHDAIRVTEDDKGDALLVSNFFGRGESVVRFLDRSYGQELRQKTLDGFKDAQFGFSLKFGFLNSMMGSKYITPTKELLSSFDKQDNFIYYSNEDEAIAFQTTLLNEAKQISDKYLEVKTTNDESHISKFVNDNYDDTVITQLWSTMAEPSDENKWKLEVVQVIKP